MRTRKISSLLATFALLCGLSAVINPAQASNDHSHRVVELSVPGGILATPASTSILLRFNAVPNANSYKVRVYAGKDEHPLRTLALFTSGQSVTSLMSSSTYKITVQAIGNGSTYSNSEESRKISATTLIGLAIPAFTLTPAVATATAGTFFTSPTPVSTGGAISSYSIVFDVFPLNGLTFNTTTGIISGTPATEWITNSYTIIAHNSSGIASQSFTLITQPAPPVVPDLSGLLEGAATSALNANGFMKGSVTTTDVGANSSNDGQVKSQTPAAGSALTVGGSVDLVLYAYVAPVAITYNVTYHGNTSDTGSVPLDVNGPYLEAANVSVLDASGLGKTGYIFAGWNTQSDGGGAAIPQPGYPTFSMPAANVDLYAQWINNTFSITWDDNGGSGSSGGDSTYIGGSQITGWRMISPTYRGFKFVGWNTLANGSGVDVSAGYSPPSDFLQIYSNVTLFAHWVNNTFSITWNNNFDPNFPHQYLSAGASTYVGGESISDGFASNPPVQDGFTFLGWIPNDSLNYAYQGYLNFEPYGDITFTAAWSANTDNLITWNANGGSSTSAGPIIYIKGATIGSLPAAPTQDGYSFVDWYDNSEFTGSAIDSTYLPLTPYSAITFYAKWSANTDNAITWDDQSPTTASSGGSTSYTTATAVSTIRATDPIKTGYAFDGWYTQTNGAGTKVIDGSYTPISPFGAITFYANWIVVVVVPCESGGPCMPGNTGPGGGIIFYHDPAGFNCGSGFTPTGSPTGGLCHYLEAAPFTNVRELMAWSGNFHAAIGTTGTAIGTGYKNTLAMYAQASGTTPNRAVTFVLAYRGPTSSLTDWYLPSKDEMVLVEAQQAIVGRSLAAVYWTSSEYDANNAWYQSYGIGPLHGLKSLLPGVRPIRAF